MKRFEIITTPPQSTTRFTFDLQRFADLGSLQRDDSGAYLIGSVDDLKTLATYSSESGHNCDGLTFKLTADITFSYTSDTDNNFTGIGSSSSNCQFKGTFDGQGFTISGIRIYKTGSNFDDRNCGLFRDIKGGTIKNVTLSDTKITGYDSVGGFVGYNSGGTIENCTVTDSVIIGDVQSNSSNHGGIIGYDVGGKIKNCVSSATVVASGSSCTAYGGIIGGQLGNVTNANVKATYSVGAVYGQRSSGSFTGCCSYNTTVNGDVMTDAVVLTVPAGVTAVDGGVSHDGKIYAKKNSTVTITLSVDSSNYFIFSGISGATKNSDGTYKYTVGETDATLIIDGLRKVDGLTYNSTDGCYEISSAAALNELAAFVNAGNNCAGLTFKLTGDITFNHTDDWNNVNSTESNFTAIGDKDHGFSGTFDGQGFTISGIRIYKSGNTNADGWQGLFGNIDTYYVDGVNYEGTVKNVTLSDTRITGLQEVGGIVGYNVGIVENCHVTDTVAIHAVQDNSHYHGGIAGENINASTIKDCTSSATITTSAENCNKYGGIVGLNEGTLENCLALNANITGSSNVGAIIGVNSSVKNTNNLYNNCIVTNYNNSNVTTNIGVGATNNNSSDGTGAEIACIINLPESVTADSGILYGGKLYATSGATVLLMPKPGYQINSVTGGDNVTDNSDGTYSVTVQDGVTVDAGLDNTEITYIGADGNEVVITASQFITVWNSGTSWGSGTYVVKSDVTIGAISCAGDEINLILCDGATLTVNDGIEVGTLNIFAQSKGTGTLNANSTSRYSINCDKLNVCGGKANFNALTTVKICLDINDGSDNGVNINGGEVSFTNNCNSYATVWFEGSNSGFNVNGGKVTVTNNGSYGTPISGHNNPAATINLNGGTMSVSNNSVTECDVKVGSGCHLIAEDGNVYDSSTASDTLKTVLRGHTVTTLDATNYLITVPEGVTVTGDNVNQISGKYFSTAGNVTLTIGNSAALGNVTGIENVAADSSGQVTFNVSSDVTITDENIFYAVTVSGATISGNSISVDGNDYYNGEVTVTAKTGYVVDSPVTVTQDRTITATLDTANHYVLANDTSTLATVDNTTDYPDLVQVYQLTLPTGVTATGDIVVTDGDKTYAAGNITLTAANDYILSNITVNGTPDDDGVFTVDSNTNITADGTAIVEELNDFNNDDPSKATSVVVNNAFGDFGTGQFEKMYKIYSTKENSMLVGNAQNNTVVITGGSDNILIGGLGKDTYSFSDGGGIVTDYGIGATKTGAGKALATSTTDTGSIAQTQRATLAKSTLSKFKEQSTGFTLNATATQRKRQRSRPSSATRPRTAATMNSSC